MGLHIEFVLIAVWCIGSLYGPGNFAFALGQREIVARESLI